MPYYPGAQATGTRGVTMISRRVPTFAETSVSAPTGGFHLLATCPKGKVWKTDNIIVRNRSTTLTYWLTLYRLPLGWPGGPNVAVSDELYVIGPNEVFQPGQFHVFKMTVALGGGDSLWGFQIESTGISSGANAWGLNMIVAGDEVG